MWGAQSRPRRAAARPGSPGGAAGTYPRPAPPRAPLPGARLVCATSNSASMHRWDLWPSGDTGQCVAAASLSRARLPPTLAAPRACRRPPPTAAAPLPHATQVEGCQANLAGLRSYFQRQKICGAWAALLLAQAGGPRRCSRHAPQCAAHPLSPVHAPPHAGAAAQRTTPKQTPSQTAGAAGGASASRCGGRTHPGAAPPLPLLRPRSRRPRVARGNPAGGAHT